MRRDRTQKKAGRFWVMAAAMAVVYVLSARTPLGVQTTLTPLGVLDLDEPLAFKDQAPATSPEWDFFGNRESFGFLSPGGEVRGHYRLAAFAASDGDRLVVPDLDDGITSIYDLMKGARSQQPFSGYPFFSASRFFFVRPDQAGISELDKTGKTSWAREFGSVLTCGSAAGPFSAWGTLGGEIVVQRDDGGYEILRPAFHGVDSLRPCVYAAAISRDGRTMAALYGQGPQYALFYEDMGAGYRLVHKRKLELETTKAEAALVSADGSFAVMRSAAGLLVYDVARKTSELLHPEWFGGREVESLMRPCGDAAVALLFAVGDERRFALLQRGAMQAYFKVDRDASGIDYSKSGTLIISGPKVLRRYRLAETQR